MENMVYNEGGSFDYGEIKPFWITPKPVSVAEYKKFCEETGYEIEALSWGISSEEPTYDHNPNLEGFLEDYPKASMQEIDALYLTEKDVSSYLKWVGGRLPFIREVYYLMEHSPKNGDPFYNGYHGFLYDELHSTTARVTSMRVSTFSEIELKIVGASTPFEMLVKSVVPCESVYDTWPHGFHYVK